MAYILLFIGRMGGSLAWLCDTLFPLTFSMKELMLFSISLYSFFFLFRLRGRLHTLLGIVGRAWMLDF
jgi:hypothetical protein